MGVLGWDEERALRADPVAIELAYEGWCDQRDALARIIYRSQGSNQEEPPPRGAIQESKSLADRLKAAARVHNAAWKEAQRARSGAKGVVALRLPRPEG
jgi:hypothetical protein